SPPLETLNPMARWCLRAAGMFGRRFSMSDVMHLVAGPESREVPTHIEHLVRDGHLRQRAPREKSDSAERDRFGLEFPSGASLARARSLSRPAELRLGTTLVHKYDPARRPRADRITSIEVSCPTLASPQLL